LDARTAFSDGLKYLMKTGDSLFQPETIGLKHNERTVQDLIHALRGRNPGCRLEALWELPAKGVEALHALDEVVECLHDANPILRADAAHTLGSFGRDAERAATELLRAFNDPDSRVRGCAAEAIGKIKPPLKEAIPDLIVLLSDNNRNVAWYAAIALREFGRDATSATPRLLKNLTNALVDCNHPLIDSLARAICDVLPDDTERQAGQLLASYDRELRQRAIKALQSIKQNRESEKADSKTSNNPIELKTPDIGP